jgi:hypothetical protein
MRKYLLAIWAASLFGIPTVAFSESIHVALGGVRVGPSHHRYYNRYEGLYDRYESEQCRMLRAPCTHKEELAEQGTGKCRRYRELCD